MSTGNVRDFVSSFRHGITDLSRASRFDVLIPIPTVLAPFYSGMGNQLTLRCESTEMPGRAFATTERKIGSAPVQKFPYQTTYNDWTATFIVSEDMSEKLFFDQWMDLINPVMNYNFRYKVNYASEIAINQYDQQRNLTYRSVLIDAFPLAVNQLDLDWSSEGYHRLSVVFAYTSWQIGTFSGMGQNLGINALESFMGG